VGVPPAIQKPCGQDAHEKPCEQNSYASFFNPFAEIEISSHKLPHWNQSDCYCFVTWRLDDAMPKEKLDEWNQERDAWLARHPKPWDKEIAQQFHHKFSHRLDEWLDAGHGSCLLQQPAIRKIVTNALVHFDGQRYELTAYVVMPNHVHVLLRLHEEQALSDILHSWKSFTAKAIHKAQNTTGTLWQPEYWDRLIRNERHFSACLNYLRQNPVKAHLANQSFTFWERSVSPASEKHRIVGVSPAIQKPCGQDAHAPIEKPNGRDSHDPLI